MTWGGARKGAGRKSKLKAPPTEAADEEFANLTGATAEEILDLSMRVLAASGKWAQASLAAARAIAARAKVAAGPQGKKEQQQVTAEARASRGRFAPPPPPGQRPN